MSARIAPALVARIQELRGEGRRFEEIAAEVGVSLNTARKYGREADVERAVAASPAAALDAESVEDLLWVAKHVVRFDCPGCGHPLRRWVTEANGKCTACGEGWVVTRE